MSATNLLDTVVERRHTSPHAKWLLNEAAALRGELARLLSQQQQLARREAEIRKTLAALELVAAPLPVPAGAEAPSSVNAHHRYGPRGTLTRLLLERLEASYPAGVDTLALVETVIGKLGIVLATAVERREYRRHVNGRLRALAQNGRVERLPGIGPHDSNSLGVWRHVPSKPRPSIEALQRFAEAAVPEPLEGV